MSARFRPTGSAGNAIGAEQRPTDICDDAPLVTEILKNHLMAEARNRTIQQTVAGGRFCAVRRAAPAVVFLRHRRGNKQGVR